MGKLLISHRSTIYPCYIPVLGEFNRSWSYKTYPFAKVLLFVIEKTTHGIFVVFNQVSYLCAKSNLKNRINMETKSRSLFNNALIYGLLTAGISIVFSILAYILDVPFKSPIMYFSFIILLAGIIYGTLQYRNTYLGGYISFGKAFLSGFIIVMVAAIVAALYSYVFLTFIDPAYLEKIIVQSMEETEAKMIEKGLSEDQMGPALEMTRKFMSPAIMSVFSVLGSALFGAILSLLSAAFLKKEDKTFDGQFKDVQ